MLALIDGRSVTGWMCSCPVGFTGTLCELEECVVNPCVAASTCIPLNLKETKCVCPLGRYGLFCENGQLAFILITYSLIVFNQIKKNGKFSVINFNFSLIKNHNIKC